MTKIEFHRAFGRIIEILISLFFLLTVFPIIYIVMAVIVKRRSAGPAIVTSIRRRDDGYEYDALTFRVDNKDSFIARMPQLINLLRGDIPLTITATYDTGSIVAPSIPLDPSTQEQTTNNIENNVDIEQDFRS